MQQPTFNSQIDAINFAINVELLLSDRYQNQTAIKSNGDKTHSVYLTTQRTSSKD